MSIDKQLIDKLLADYKGPEDLVGETGLLKELTKALVERAMQAELTHQLGYEKRDPAGRGSLRLWRALGDDFRTLVLSLAAPQLEQLQAAQVWS